jgi:hypothetical protein
VSAELLRQIDKLAALWDTRVRLCDLGNGPEDMAKLEHARIDFRAEAENLATMLPALRAAVKDSMRLEWLGVRIRDVDFSQPEGTVLSFTLPHNANVSASLRNTIDRARGKA